MPGQASFLFGCCAGALLLSFLLLLLVGQWVAPEALIPVWLSFVTIPIGLSFVVLIPYRKTWADADRALRLRIVAACVGGLAGVHWSVIGVLLVAVSAG